MKKIFALLLFTCLPVVGQVDPAPGKGDTPIQEDLAGLQVKPQYPGGMAVFNALISNNLRPPEIEQEDDITLKIYVSFVIEKDGSLTNINVLRHPGYGSDVEAKRVIALSEKWSPGIIDGKPVRARYSLPIVINIKGTGKKKKPAEGAPPTEKP
jgi:Gram-negative bacterial TonB protein C-terminal